MEENRTGDSRAIVSQPPPALYGLFRSVEQRRDSTSAVADEEIKRKIERKERLFALHIPYSGGSVVTAGSWRKRRGWQNGSSMGRDPQRGLWEETRAKKQIRLDNDSLLEFLHWTTSA